MGYDGLAILRVFAPGGLVKLFDCVSQKRHRPVVAIGTGGLDAEKHVFKQ